MIIQNSLCIAAKDILSVCMDGLKMYIYSRVPGVFWSTTFTDEEEMKKLFNEIAERLED
jgi:hypothetical protein